MRYLTNKKTDNKADSKIDEKAYLKQSNLKQEVIIAHV